MLMVGEGAAVTVLVPVIVLLVGMAVTVTVGIVVGAVVDAAFSKLITGVSVGRKAVAGTVSVGGGETGVLVRVRATAVGARVGKAG